MFEARSKRKWPRAKALLSCGSLLCYVPIVAGMPLLCSDGMTEGYSTFTELQFALISDPFSGTTFTICPNSVLEIPDGEAMGLPIYGSATIQCGDDGSRTNFCLILGSGRYLQIGESGQNPFFFAIDFEMKGVTMRGGASTAFTSVWIDDSSLGSYTFTDCAFEVRTLAVLFALNTDMLLNLTGLPQLLSAGYWWPCWSTGCDRLLPHWGKSTYSSKLSFPGEILVAIHGWLFDPCSLCSHNVMA